MIKRDNMREKMKNIVTGFALKDNIHSGILMGSSLIKKQAKLYGKVLSVIISVPPPRMLVKTVYKTARECSPAVLVV